MKTTIHQGGLVLKIDFDKNDASWALLVIDDRADWVKRMVLGVSDPITGATVAGLDAGCVRYAAVDEYWSSFRPSGERFEKGVLLLAWMAHDAADVGAITFSSFPNDAREMESLLQISAGSDGFAREVACLIDMRDDSVTPPRVRFFETWEMLDSLHHPQYARARFTRGGQDLPSWTERVPIVRKEPPEGGYDVLKLELQDWLMRVRGVPSADLFQRHTEGNAPDCCHNPSNLFTASLKARTRVSKRMASSDCCGVWQWAEELAAQDPLPAGVAHRWLCAKAVQTTELASDIVPLTAVIGICEGARFLVPELAGYAVSSPLMSIPPDERVNKLKALGVVHLAQGSYGEFARALRDWIVQTEQFEPPNAKVEFVEIVSSPGTVRLEFRYSASVEKIFSDGRRGRARRAWQRLAVFAKSTAHADNTVTITFVLSN